jgi:hypothetical protein
MEFKRCITEQEMQFRCARNGHEGIWRRLPDDSYLLIDPSHRGMIKNNTIASVVQEMMPYWKGRVITNDELHIELARQRHV